MPRLPLISGSRVPSSRSTRTRGRSPAGDAQVARGRAGRRPRGPALSALRPRRSPTWPPAEAERRSSSSRRSLPLPGRPSIRGAAPSGPSSRSSRRSVCRRTAARSSSPEASSVVPGGGSVRPSSPARRPGISAAPSRCTTPRRPTSRPLDIDGGPSVGMHPSLLAADLIVSMTAAETSERGGPCALLDACAAEVIASPPPAQSLLAPSLSPTGTLAGKVAAALARRTAVTSVSLVLDHPRLTGVQRLPGVPSALTALRRSPVRRIVNALPGCSATASCRACGARSRPRPSSPDRLRSRTPRLCFGASRCAGSSSRCPSTPSSSRFRGDRCTSRGSRPTRSGRRDRARACPAAVARRVTPLRGRNRDPPARLPPHLRARRRGGRT